ncbi:MAG: universal stress protein [Pseudolabrys sp.]|nr:universal stress protein [Pseudolabrys sp.]MDP2297953.1 universal stress protein [Pseudolabrys sp.]
MSFKDTLLVLTSYPKPTPRASVDQAMALGVALGTNMSAISFEIDVKVPGGSNFLADTLLNLPGIIAAEKQKAAANARDLLDAFEVSAKQRGILGERLLERCLTALVPDLLVDHARLRDLTIIPIRDGDSIEHWYAESIVFGSGRPCMILPDPTRYDRPPTLQTVAIAWDFSRPAARAVADALPILQQAELVRAITVAHEKSMKTTRSSEQLAAHLLMHGVKVELDVIDAQDRSIGDVLGEYVNSQKIDLLVMGAYGHSRIRDFVLGGATKSMLQKPPLPLFLSH